MLLANRPVLCDACVTNSWDLGLDFGRVMADTSPMTDTNTYRVMHFTRHEYAVFHDGSTLVARGTRDYCVAFGAAMNAGADTDQAEAIAAPYKDFNVHGAGGLDTTVFRAAAMGHPYIAEGVRDDNGNLVDGQEDV